MRKVLLIGIPVVLVVLAALFFLINPLKLDFTNMGGVTSTSEDDERDFAFVPPTAEEERAIDRTINTMSLYPYYSIVASDNKYILSEFDKFGVWNKGGVTLFDFFGKNLGNGTSDVMEVSLVLSNDTTAPYPFEVGSGKYRVSLQRSGQFLYVEMYLNEEELALASDSELSIKLSELAYTAMYRVTHPETMTTGSQTAVSPAKPFLTFSRDTVPAE